MFFGPEDGWLNTPVVSRASLRGDVSSGPLIVEEYDTTTVLAPGCRVRLDDWSNMVIEVDA